MFETPQEIKTNTTFPDQLSNHRQTKSLKFVITQKYSDPSKLNKLHH